MFTTFTAMKIFLTEVNVMKTSHESCNFHSKLFQMKPNVNLTFVPSLLVVCSCVWRGSVLLEVTLVHHRLWSYWWPIELFYLLLFCLSYFRYLKTQSMSHDSTLATLHLSLCIGGDIVKPLPILLIILV